MPIDLPAKYKSLTWQERREVREQYTREQGGKCFYCGCKLSNPPPDRIQKKYINWRAFPANFLRHPIHLQHDHDTGLTEGAVHARCNAVMWQYEDR